MKNEQNPNTSDISKNDTNSNETEIKENKQTILDDKNSSKVDELNKKKIPWHETNQAKLLFAITGIFLFTSAIYEYFVIPKRNYEDKQKIQKLEQENNFLKNTSELLTALRENKKLREENTNLIEKQKKLADLIAENKNLKASLEEWKKSQQSWQNAYNKSQSNLLICNNNFNIKQEINSLLAKIDKNNEDIKNSGFHGYNPSEIKYQTIQQDNTRLLNIISNYQNKLECSKP